MPDAKDALTYWEVVDDENIPVLADHEQLVIPSTPYEGTALPGKCVLTPQMEILYCFTGHGNEQGFDAIVEHWNANK